jgi:transposase InsO family protein
MPKRKEEKLRPPKNNDALQKRLYELELENDILREAFLLGDYPKAMGFKIEDLTVEQKTKIVLSLRPKHMFLKCLLEKLQLTKCAYDYSRKTTKKVQRDKSARDWVLFAFKEEKKAKNNFGYRQVHEFLRNLGIRISEKVIQRWMRVLKLNPIIKRCRRYCSYAGTVGIVANNLLDRDFSASSPNEKWVTDITEFHINDYKIYLSPMIDLFNGEVIAWTISQSPNMELVMAMLHKALSTLKPWENPFVHSDQGHQYQREQYVRTLEKSGCIQSMSRKGTSPDNAAAEGFFGLLKKQFFYNNDYSDYTPQEFIDALNDWIDWFNKERAKPELNGMSPVRYRVCHQKGISAIIELSSPQDSKIMELVA